MSLERKPPAIKAFASNSAEAAAAGEEFEYRRIVEMSRDLFWSVDLEGRFTLLNRASRSIYGREPEEMLGRPMFDFAAPEVQGRDFTAFQRVLGGESLLRYETTHQAKDGRGVHLSLSAMPLRDGNGAVTGAAGTAVDISDRKQSETALENQAAFARFNPDTVIGFKPDGEVAYYNAAALETARSFGENHPRALLPKEAAQIIQRCMAGSQGGIRHANTINGRTLAWSFFRVAQGQAALACASEITERLTLERQLIQTQKMECVGRLAGGVAHDLTNILTIIQGHLSGARLKSRGNKELEEPLLEIGMAADRAENLTRQLLMFSSQRAAQTRKLNLRELLDKLLRVVGPLLPAGIELRVERPEGLLPVRGEEAMLEQLVLNLVLNARDAMPAGGRLTIGAGLLDLSEEESRLVPGSRAGPCVCLHVTDTGAGIGPDEIPRVFEPFQSTKDVGKGAALGLAAVYGIVRQHHGWTHVASQLGQGATFRVFLPRAEGT